MLKLPGFNASITRTSAEIGVVPSFVLRSIAVCECSSTRPGIAVKPEPSITVVPPGTETSGPISRMTPSRTRIDTFSSTSPAAVHTASRFSITMSPRGTSIAPGGTWTSHCEAAGAANGPTIRTAIVSNVASSLIEAPPVRDRSSVRPSIRNYLRSRPHPIRKRCRRRRYLRK